MAMFESNVFVFSVETDSRLDQVPNPKSGTHVSRGYVPPVSDGLFWGRRPKADAAKIAEPWLYQLYCCTSCTSTSVFLMYLLYQYTPEKDMCGQWYSSGTAGTAGTSQVHHQRTDVSAHRRVAP